MKLQSTAFVIDWTRALFLVGAFCLTVNSALASEAILKHRATLRHDPSSQHAPILTLDEGDDVELIDPTPTANYYHVRTSDGDEGWVYGRSLEITDSVPSPVSPPIVASRAPQPAATAGVLSSINTSWAKPDPNSTTFDGDDGPCGPSGDGGDTFTNTRKNRTDVPAQYHAITWKALQSLPYPVAKRSLADWTPSQLNQIKPYEGVAVSVVGYLTAVKVEKGGSGESTNCHFTKANEVDWHMPLVQKAGDTEDTAIVVETTPRVRESHPQWTPTALSDWVNSDAPVRISGWTLLDPEHRAHLGKYRSTLWEIHPITKIEVFKDGAWVSLDELQ